MFKEIAGYEGRYLINEEGVILSRCRKNEIVCKPYKLKSRNKSVYWRIKLSFNNKTKQHLIHRLVAETFLDNPDNLPQVNHKDKNSLNNNINNLEWCTAQENVEHSHGKVKKFIGPNSEFRECTISALAREFNLSIGNLAEVCKGNRKQHKGWRSLNELA